MAVNIDSFKTDLENLKNQRSIIQAKLDEANRHVSELTETLKGMGYSSIDEAKAAYAKQLADAEGQHALVKQLIEEIKSVDHKLPTKDEVIERLNALSAESALSADAVPSVAPIPSAEPIPSTPSVPTIEPEPMAVSEVTPVTPTKPQPL